MWVSNVGGAQETAISTSGGLGEAETGGVVINMIPKDGSNVIAGSPSIRSPTTRCRGATSPTSCGRWACACRTMYKV